jgi:hypothetical protein
MGGLQGEPTSVPPSVAAALEVQRLYVPCTSAEPLNQAAKHHATLQMLSGSAMDMPAVTYVVLHMFVCFPVGDHCNDLLRVVGRTQPVDAQTLFYNGISMSVASNPGQSPNMRSCVQVQQEGIGRGPGPAAAYTLG